MKLKKFAGLLVLGGMLFSSLFLNGQVSAAGSAVITVEASSSVTAGANVQLRFYVTPSGENVYDASVNVTLSNLRYKSYSSSGVPFAGYAGVPSGGSSGSTSFSIAVSHSGAHAGSSGKTLMGTITVQAASSPGTGQVTLSSAQADDPDIDPMNTTSQNRSITISAPQEETCPAGKIGTPPNCTTPPDDDKPSDTSNPTNPVDKPNPDSDTKIPDDDPSKPAKTVSEKDLSEAVKDAGQQVAKQEATSKKSFVLPKLAIYGSIALVTIGVAAAITLQVLHRRRISSFNSHIAYPINQTPPEQNQVITPTQPTEPPQGDDKNPPTNSSGPTIITPQQ